MPYIKKDKRQDIDKLLEPLIGLLKSAETEEVDGELNYVITKLLWNLYSPRYFNYNRAIGVLESVKQEFYRRKVAPYEDEKMKENGDIQ